MTAATKQELLASKLAALSDSFAQSLPGKLADIEQARQKCLRNEAQPDDFNLLCRLLHTLAGSAGTFGFSSLGQAAGRIEGYIHDFIHQDESLHLNFAPIAGEIHELLRWAALDPKTSPILPATTPAAVMQTESSDLVGRNVSMPNARLLYLLEQKPQENQYVVNQLENYGYQVQSFGGLVALQQAIETRPPAVLMIDMSPGSDLQPLLQIQAELPQKIPCLFFAGDATFEHRLSAAMMDADGYFVKPVDLVALNERIDTLVRRLEKLPYRILIIDDDVFVTDFYGAVLKSAGMDVHTLQELPDIFDALAEFRPELLLIDVYMPICNGIQLAKIIRQEATYLDVPIVFLSTESNLEKQLDAIAAGGDDFLTKPMPAQHLISSLTSRVERYRSLRDLILRDSLTKLYNHSTIKDQAAVEIERARRYGKPLALAMLDLDYFKNVNDNYGHQVGDNVIRSVAQLLQKMVRRVDVVGRYGGEEFAVIFPETGADGAMQVLEKLRASFAKIKHHSQDHQWYFEVTFSAGVVELANNVDVSTLFAQADTALYAAKNAGRNRIRQYLEGKLM